ncbi:MAG: arsenic resistance N-acetyltransferase ArsN2 [Rhizomicrobium sp.]
MLDLLPSRPATEFAKEEGVPFLHDARIAGNDPDLAAALKAVDLPTDDLLEANRIFFDYRTLGGTLLGYGGYELYDKDVLIRSVVVPQAGRGIGRNLIPLLLYRAFEGKARRAWLLTTTAAPFFEKLGFQATARAEAPESILSTRQAKSLCPASATLLSRSIGF